MSHNDSILNILGIKDKNMADCKIKLNTFEK